MHAAVHIQTVGPYGPENDKRIEADLKRLPGVDAVRSDWSTGLTSVLFDMDVVDTGAIAEHIRECGFEAHKMIMRPLERV